MEVFLFYKGSFRILFCYTDKKIPELGYFRVVRPSLV